MPPSAALPTLRTWPAAGVSVGARIWLGPQLVRVRTAVTATVV